jgi:hypothetical protein
VKDLIPRLTEASCSHRFFPLFSGCVFDDLSYIYIIYILYIYCIYTYGFSIRTFWDPWVLFMWSFVNLSAFEVFSSRIFHTFCIANLPASCETLRPVLPARWSYGDALHFTDFPDVAQEHGDMSLNMVFMDQRGTTFHDDARMAELGKSRIRRAPKLL